MPKSRSALLYWNSSSSRARLPVAPCSLLDRGGQERLSAPPSQPDVRDRSRRNAPPSKRPMTLSQIYAYTYQARRDRHRWAARWPCSDSEEPPFDALLPEGWPRRDLSDAVGPLPRTLVNIA